MVSAFLGAFGFEDLGSSYNQQLATYKVFQLAKRPTLNSKFKCFLWVVRNEKRGNMQLPLGLNSGRGLSIERLNAFRLVAAKGMGPFGEY